ncbi:eukaryotic translation initiation factor 3 subunit M-like [Lineus longissimus]|uniref:eukaryotic translation initiation factor 3 subunit M-like n=1 Tax=Lineus longissimus TaxID=88925 RepID=UPI00315DDBB8
MSVPAFIDAGEVEQILELRSFLKSLGAEISEENSERGLVTDLLHVIEAANICWKESADNDHLECVFNSIISLILIVPQEKSENVVVSFCEKVAKAPPGDKRATVRIRLLNHLFHGLDERSSHRYLVYYHLVRLAGQVQCIDYITTDLRQLKTWIGQWEISSQKYQTLLRALYDAFVAAKQSEQSTKVMIELLGTYTEENASQARDDAHKCIVTCLGDPSTFLLDHLLTLKPVKFLEGELIHDLLTIFVSGNLDGYMKFYNSNTDYVNTLGLSHDDNMQKMRLLTFMQMAENKKEIDFETIQKEMKLAPNEVEAFIIDVVRTKAVRCKIEQREKRIVISSTTHRTFQKQQWQLLRDNFITWRENLTNICASLAAITPALDPGKPPAY